MGKKAKTRVFGPQLHRRRWRIRIRSPEGAYVTESFETEEEAARAKRAVEAALASEDAWRRVAALEEQLDQARTTALTGGKARTVQAVADAYLEARAAEIKPSTQDNYRRCFRLFLADVWDTPVASITPKKAAALYDSRVSAVSAARHHVELTVIRYLWEWAADRQWVAPGVWGKVRPRGRKNAGKPQPRQGEIGRLYERAVDLATQGGQHSLGALAILCALVLGMRRSEIMALQGRDLDSGCIYVEEEGTKTRNGVRIIKVPPVLLPLLERRAAEVGPGGKLFPRSGNWLLDNVYRLCDELGIPRYCTHALRGVHASLAFEAGATAEQVARTLGHGGSEVTRRHYISPEAIESRATSRRLAFADDLEERRQRVTGSSGDRDPTEVLLVATSKKAINDA